MSIQQTKTKEWTFATIKAVYEQPLLELIVDAAKVHRQFFDGREIQVSSLVSVKTGGCSEDCHYCPQSARYATGVKRQQLMTVSEVKTLAEAAKAYFSILFVSPPGGSANRPPEQ